MSLTSHLGLCLRGGKQLPGWISEALGVAFEALGLVLILGLVSEALGPIFEALGCIVDALGLASRRLRWSSSSA